MKAIVLVRVSTERQHLDEQREEVVAMAKHDGYDDSNIILIENKESAIKIKDETESLGLTKLFQLIENDSTINCVYAYELSRIGRKEDVNLKVKNFLIDHKVNLKLKEPSMVLLDKDGSVNSGAEIVFSLYNTMSHQEMRLKKARLKRGKIEAVSRGEIGMGKCKYGYYVDKDKHIHIDEEKGEAIRYIFNEYIDGKSTKKIFKECYERGWFTSRNTKYSAAATIIKILRDDAYCGTTTENGIVRYPQIISRETFDKVTELRETRKTNKVDTKNLYLGKSIIYSDGKILHGHNKEKYVGRFTKMSISLKLMDFIIWNETKDLQIKNEIVNSKDRLEELWAQYDATTLKKNTCVKRMQEIKEKEEKIEDLYLVGNKSREWLKKQYSSIEEERKDITEKMNMYENILYNLNNEIGNFDRNDYSSILSHGELDIFYDTTEKKKELVDKNILRIDLEKGEVFKTIRITSKKFGELPHFYQYIWRRRRYFLFKCKYNEKGHKIMKKIKF